MNYFCLMGRTTADPEIRVTQTGTMVARVSLAVDSSVKEETYFIDLKAFGKQAEFLEKYGKKGKKYLVSGHITTSSAEKDGKKTKYTDHIIDRVEFCESLASTGQ